MERFWSSWLFRKGGVFVFGAATALAITYVHDEGVWLLELVWQSWLDVSKLDYGAGVIAPFFAGISALAALASIRRPPISGHSERGDNERAFDLGLQIWSGATALFAAGYWLSHATEEEALLHFVALLPLILLMALWVAGYLVVTTLQQNRMSQSQEINEGGQRPSGKFEDSPEEANDRVNFLFADARALYDNAIEGLAQDNARNAAEKAWGATKRATDAIVLAREGYEPQSAGQARRALLRISAGNQTVWTLQGEYHLRARMLHIDCFYEGNCEPEQEMTDLIRSTISYIQTAKELSAEE